MNNNGIIWTSTTKYVDIDTGEEITKHQTKNMITIKTNKHEQLNWNKTKGNIEYTKQCRRNPQINIFSKE